MGRVEEESREGVRSRGEVREGIEEGRLRDTGELWRGLLLCWRRKWGWWFPF